MFSHNKRLQYTVRVSAGNRGLANLMLEQFGGPQGELAAAARYFTQALSEEDPGRRDILFDIATEELNSAGVPWTAAYIDTIGAPTADLRSSLAAEARAKTVSLPGRRPQLAAQKR